MASSRLSAKVISISRRSVTKTLNLAYRSFGVEMGDEIFTSESFINFVIFFIEILNFNYNVPITRKNVSQV